jgi:hypothetical protein
VWKAPVIFALKGAQLTEFLEDKTEVLAQTLSTNDKKMKVPNPKFSTYIGKQQHVLNFLVSSLSKENVITMASSQSRARVINTHMTLSTTWKGNLTIAQYVGK